MKRPDLDNIPPAVIKYIEHLEAKADGSSELMNAINLVNSAYAKEFRKMAKSVNLLTDTDFFEQYIKIVGQSTKLREFSISEKDTPKEKEESGSKDSIFELTLKKQKLSK